MLYKIALVGNCGAGKSTWIKKLETGQFYKKYTPTADVDVIKISFNTSDGLITFKFYDCTGRKGHDIFTNRNKYIDKSQGLIVMYDCYTYKEIKYHCMISDWIVGYTKHVVICGNKNDLSPSSKYNNSTYSHCEISTKNDCDLQPLLLMIRKLSGNNELVFFK